MISNFYLYISWNVDPALYDGFITLRYYSLFFALSFIIGFQIVKKMFDNESAPEQWMDKLLVYTVLGTILGARLGHVIFYEPKYYLENISEILMVWKGGLASHGAAVALIISMWIFSKKVTHKKTMWTMDKLVVAVALAAGFIRVGNLMNSEIVGVRTESESGFFYEYKAKNQIASFFSVESEKIHLNKTSLDTTINDIKYSQLKVSVPLGNKKMNPYYCEAFSNAFNFKSIDSDADFFSSIDKNDFVVSSTNELILPIYIIPRIPTQLYEAISYWLIFCFLFWGYWKRDWHLYSGKLFGAFLTLLFASRFFVEFFKEHQTLENSSLLTMGQYLSIPLVGVGLYYWIKSKRIDTYK
jgi:prolipoprotein diacylglyceryl transferase